jgi:hypothetical protein
MLTNDSRQRQATHAHPTHERAQQYRHRDSRGSRNELQHLEPDDFIDQRSRTAGDEKYEKEEMHAGGSITVPGALSVRRCTSKRTA